MEQPRVNIDAVALRLMIITSFLLGAIMILLSLNVSILRQSASTGVLGPVELVLALSIALTLVSSLTMMFLSAVMLVTMDLALFSYSDRLKVIRRARTFLGLTSALILASFGSTFIVGLGANSPMAWILGAIGYGGAIAWALARAYYLARFVNARTQGQD